MCACRADPVRDQQVHPLLRIDHQCEPLPQTVLPACKTVAVLQTVVVNGLLSVAVPDLLAFLMYLLFLYTASSTSQTQSKNW